MRKKSTENPDGSQIKLLRRYLKVKIQEDNITFRDHNQSRNHVYDLIKRAVVNGESHSALIIGPRGCGKTTMINSIIHQLSKEIDLEKDAIIVRLNGLVHCDDKVALKSITAQVQLENAVEGRVFGTFAEQLAFLLSCLYAGQDRRCRSMVFLLEECHMFCRAGKMQTLLYNLFDVTHSKQAPMCVLGITNRIDVVDLLEKRVKSRFSHRHIFIFPNESEDEGTPLERYIKLFMQLLSVSVKRDVKKRSRKSIASEEPMSIDQDIPFIPDEILRKCNLDSKELTTLDPNFLEDWNAHIASLARDENVVDSIEKFCYYYANEQVFRNVLFQLASKLNNAKPRIDHCDVTSVVNHTVAGELGVRQVQSLSPLELCVLVAMLHGSEVLGGQPLNFHMVLHRYQKFASTNSSTQSVPRAVILKAFEHLQQLELITPVKGQADHKGQKEHMLHSLCVTGADIRTAVSTARHLPTEIAHWLNNHIG